MTVRKWIWDWWRLSLVVVLYPSLYVDIEHFCQSLWVAVTSILPDFWHHSLSLTFPSWDTAILTTLQGPEMYPCTLTTFFLNQENLADHCTEWVWHRKHNKQLRKKDACKPWNRNTDKILYIGWGHSSEAKSNSAFHTAIAFIFSTTKTKEKMSTHKRKKEKEKKE